MNNNGSRTYKKIILTVLLIVLAFITVYLFLAYYYRDGFSINTWINGVYCTGKTVEEVNGELLFQTEAPVVVLSYNGETCVFDMSEYGYICDYYPVLLAYMERQNSLLWVDNVTFHRNHTINPECVFDEEKLYKDFVESSVVRKVTTDRTEDFCIRYSPEEGWSLYDGLTKRLDVDLAFAALKECILNKSNLLKLEECDCYYDVALSEKQEKVRKVWDRLDKILNCDIVYDLGENEGERKAINRRDMGQFIVCRHGENHGGDNKEDMPLIDNGGDFVLDENAVSNYIDKITEEYDTYGKDREFMSTRGEKVIVPAGGTYGSQIDSKAEIDFLLNNLLLDEFHNGSENIHVPEYKHQGIVRGKNDIGDTYIEVDMTNQKMYYYVKGEIELETDVVTGNMKRKMDTPAGVNFVYNKQKNRVLRGPGYATPVKFWVPVKGSIGIHDANWRDEFGGDIYKTNGSHGCVNTPTDVMSELYEMVEIGTPVIMYY